MEDACPDAYPVFGLDLVFEQLKEKTVMHPKIQGI